MALRTDRATLAAAGRPGLPELAMGRARRSIGGRVPGPISDSDNITYDERGTVCPH
jgi:hypothetical protein